MEFTLTGQTLTHLPSRATMIIDPKSAEDLRHEASLYDDSDDMLDEMAADLMLAAGVIAYDEWNNRYDTPDAISEMERIAAEDRAEERSMQRWYQRSVL